MNEKNNFPLDQITKMADDVRLIQNFSENHGFDSTLFTALSTPKSNKLKVDWSLITMGISIVFLLITIGIIKFWNPPLNDNIKNFVFLIGFVFAIIASIATHIKFKEKIVTAIALIGLLVVLFIGADIFTPKEVVTKATELVD